MKKIKQYHLIELLGKGASGEVWKAKNGDQEVAIKLFHEGFQSIGAEEFQALKQLQHPAIVQAYAFDKVGEQFYLVMEYVVGENLKTAKTENFSEEGMFQIVRQLAEGLNYAHEKGVIHRDIKPANVIITEDGNAKILDFGAAAHIELEGGERILEGSYKYMSPEQLAGKINRQSDIWSFGISLYEWLTSRYPYQAETLEDLAISFLKTDVLAAHHVNSSIPIDLSGIIDKCMRPELENRYLDFDQILQDLDARPFSKTPAKNYLRLVRTKKKRYITYNVFRFLLFLFPLMPVAGYAILNRIELTQTQQLLGISLFLIGIVGFIVSSAFFFIKKRSKLKDLEYIKKLPFYLNIEQYYGIFDWIRPRRGKYELLEEGKLRAEIRSGQGSKAYKQADKLLTYFPQNRLGLSYFLIQAYENKDLDWANKIAENLYLINPDNTVHFFLDRILNKKHRSKEQLAEATKTRMGLGNSDLDVEVPGEEIPKIMKTIFIEERLDTPIKLKEVNATHLESTGAKIEWYEHYLVIRSNIQRKNKTDLTQYFDKVYTKGAQQKTASWSASLFTHVQNKDGADQLLIKAPYSKLKQASLGGHYLEFDDIGYFIFEWEEKPFETSDYLSFIQYIIKKNGRIR